MSANDFAARLRNRERILGYWSVIDSPVSTEWLAHVGWDYIALDLQHGLIGYDGMLARAHGHRLRARPGRASSASKPTTSTPIGRALDAGAVGVIVPLIDTAEDAARAVSAARYPPTGIRSYGPMRSQLRIGPTPADANRDTVVIAMIETPLGLENVEAICAVPGLDGVYVGPSDLQDRRRRCFAQRSVRRRRIRSGPDPSPARRRRGRHRRGHPHAGRRYRRTAARRGLHLRHGGVRPHPPQSGVCRAPEGSAGKLDDRSSGSTLHPVALHRIP